MPMNSYSFAKVAACTLALTVAISSHARAEQISSNDAEALIKALQAQAERMAEHEKKLADQEKEIEKQRRLLNQEKTEFQKMQRQVSAITGKKIPTASKADTRQPDEVGSERKAEAKEKPPEIAAVIEEGGVLLQRGKLVITPAIEYTHSSATRVAIDGFSIIPALNIGTFEISEVKRDLITPSVGVRYGVTNRFEIEAKVPYVYRQDATSARDVGVPGALPSLTTVDGADIGDVEVGAHYQINDGTQGWPYLIGNLRFKTVTGSSPFEMPVVSGVLAELPTGSGFYALQPSLTAIYPSDPVVYYSNVGYLHNFERSFANYGTIEPGDAISASMGMSLSLNEKSSFSVGYSHSTVFKTLQNGQNIANSTVLQVGALDFGYAYALNPTTNLNFTVSAGLTSDAPDVRLIMRVPMTFDLK
jgi:hypothetical protein